MSPWAEFREQLTQVRVCSPAMAGCALEPRFLGFRVCGVKVGVICLCVCSRGSMRLGRKEEGQWGLAGLSQVGQDTGGPGALAQGLMRP